MTRSSECGYAQIGLLVLGVLVWPLFFLAVPPNGAEPEAPAGVLGDDTNEVRYTVVRVTDGDTIVVDMDKEEVPVRLIGIDAPELHAEAGPECFAEQARFKAVQMLLGKEIVLVRDASQADRDAYDRLLRYVKLRSGENFNELMLKEGFAREYTHIVPYELHEAFTNAEDEAKKEGRGLWETCR